MRLASQGDTDAVARHEIQREQLKIQHAEATVKIRADERLLAEKICEGKLRILEVKLQTAIGAQSSSSAAMEKMNEKMGFLQEIVVNLEAELEVKQEVICKTERECMKVMEEFAEYKLGVELRIKKTKDLLLSEFTAELAILHEKEQLIVNEYQKKFASYEE